MKKTHTEETKEKIRQAHLGIKLSKAHRDKAIKTLHQGRGSLNPNWKGGRTLKGGYVMLRLPTGYVLEHRIVAEHKLGRKLTKGEDVHHINGQRDDNRPENLIVLTHQAHGIEHWQDANKRKQRSELMRKIRENNPWSTKKLK